jgi:hypothetical protein
VSTEVVQTKIDAATKPGLLEPEVDTPTAPVVTAPVVTAPVVTAPVVTTPAVTTPAVTTPAVTAGGGGLLTTATPTRSARDQALVDFFTTNQSKYDLGTFKTELDKLGYTAEDVARVGDRQAIAVDS